MNPANGILLSLAYILGLLFTGSLGLPVQVVSWKDYSLVALGTLALGLLAAITIPRYWRTGPRPRLWLAAAIVVALAIIYFQARLPQPAANDISQLLNSSNSASQVQLITVQGKVKSTPRLTRSRRGQFWLKATQLSELTSRDSNGVITKGVTGKLYVTVPLLQTTGLYPGQTIAVTGILYQPKPAANPGAFDFRAYLLRKGAFVGLSGRQVNFPDEIQKQHRGLWRIRQRIIRSQIRWLGSPKGQLLSSMILGRRAVDLPYDVRDQFIEAGLAHVLAASGFHISLILGSVLALMQRWGTRTQFSIGISTLIVYVGLTGGQASVMRAAIMGLGALIALVTQRQVKPLGSLLVAVTILLLFNPLWIWDIGFQLSFLATLGLLVTVSPLTKQLDWLPPVIASVIAVSLAASLWTLPLQLYFFYKIATYSVVVNVICAPLIVIISLGGFISAIAALILPVAGSAMAWLLYYPIEFLLGIVKFFNDLPGSSVAVGKISIWQLLLLYGLIGISCISRRWRLRWWLVGFVAVTFVVLPAWQTKLTKFQVNILATDQEQVLVIQDQGQVTLLNSGGEDTATFAVLPFLQQQGINQIDWAIALNARPRFRSSWDSILASLSVKTFFDTTVSQLPSTTATESYSKISTLSIAGAVESQQGNYQLVASGETMSLGSIAIKLISAEPPMLHMHIRDQNWLIFGKMTPIVQKQLAITSNFPQTKVIWWSGESLTPELLNAVEPEIAIASSNTIDPATVQLLQNNKTELYWTGHDGAIEWTPKKGFQTTLETVNNDAKLM
ncbi:MAG: DUF4131 domain-containing protein [Symploca sp. SIO1C4]|uniref:DUF4131 domain-containing protein n=1 Tax=Symploca sp. SIO1C4 TaxID=2607765 RepID=A0A6B3NGU4_9CYAN|nr:DUF4131 domain-containing protein [Symploca sp. SIO1C4]